MIGFASYAASDTWTFDGYLGTARGGYDLVRWINYSLPVVGGGNYVIDALAYASPDSHRRIAGLGVDWSWARTGWQGDIGFGLDYSQTDIDAYIESDGGGLALAVPERRIETERGRLDARIGRTVSAAWGVWQPSLRIGWRQEFANERRQVTVRLAEDTLGNPITFDTEDPDRGWGEIALGSVFVFTRGHSGFFGFRQRFGHSFLNERMLALGWRMEL